MHTSIISGVAVLLLALAPSALAVGSASVTNMCSFPVYYASIAGQPAPMQAMPPGGSMSQAYSLPGQARHERLRVWATLSIRVYMGFRQNQLRSLQHQRLPLPRWRHNHHTINRERPQQPNMCPHCLPSRISSLLRRLQPAI
jgi:hypothetical protein